MSARNRPKSDFFADFPIFVLSLGGSISARAEVWALSTDVRGAGVLGSSLLASMRDSRKFSSRVKAAWLPFFFRPASDLKVPPFRISCAGRTNERGKPEDAHRTGKEGTGTRIHIGMVRKPDHLGG